MPAGSGRITTPGNQKRFDTVAPVWLVKNGKRFEVAVYKNKIMQWRYEVETDPRQVFQVMNVFKNMKTGELASQGDLMEAFGTGDVEKIAKVILNTGKYQMNAVEREEEYQQAYSHLIIYIADVALDTSNHSGWDLRTLRNALKEYGFNFCLEKPMKVQALAGIRMLAASGLNICRAPRRLEIKLPKSAPQTALSQLLSTTCCTTLHQLGSHTAECLCAPDRLLHLEDVISRKRWGQQAIEELETNYRHVRNADEEHFINREGLPLLPEAQTPPPWTPESHWCKPRAFQGSTRVFLMFARRELGEFLPMDLVRGVLSMVDYWSYPGITFLDYSYAAAPPTKSEAQGKKKKKKKDAKEAPGEEDPPGSPAAKGGGGKKGGKAKGRKGKKGGDDVDEELLAFEKKLAQEVSEGEESDGGWGLGRGKKKGKKGGKGGKGGKKAKEAAAEVAVTVKGVAEEAFEEGDLAAEELTKKPKKKKKSQPQVVHVDKVFGKLFEGSDEDSEYDYLQPHPEQADDSGEEKEEGEGVLSGEDELVPVVEKEHKPRFRVLPNGKKVTIVGQKTVNTNPYGPEFIY